LNHLGHFALTGLLMDLLIGTASSRVVTVSSGAHHIGWMRFDDLYGERRYRKWLAYGQGSTLGLGQQACGPSTDRRGIAFGSAIAAGKQRRVEGLPWSRQR
jgi:NAD(P)-dependent dehydrogenase (short-subunit alcohol dehydrogenase family)